MVSFPLHRLWPDGLGAVRMMSPPVRRVMGAKRRPKAGGPVPGCPPAGNGPVSVSLSVEAHFKHKP